MITEAQIKALDENELAYLYYCADQEWQTMGYQIKLNFIKSFKPQAFQPMLNKYSDKLTEDNKDIIMKILNKFEANK